MVGVEGGGNNQHKDIPAGKLEWSRDAVLSAGGP